MQIYPRFEFSDVNVAPYEQPLAICEAAQCKVALAFDKGDQDILARLEDFSAPFVIAHKSFDASKILCNTPDDMVPSVPESGKALIALLNLVTAASLVPVSYEYENSGQLAVNLAPQRPDVEDRSGYQKSTKELKGHTDASFNPSAQEFLAGDDEYSPSPDFVGLACLRNPDQVPTTLALLSDVFPLLSERDKEQLQVPKFILTPQKSFKLLEGAIRVGPVIWQDDAGNWCCRFSHSHVAVDREGDQAASAALANFQSAVLNCLKPVNLMPGEILLFNNRTAVHGRRKVGTDWHPRARWLLRMYANRKATPRISPYAERSWILR